MTRMIGKKRRLIIVARLKVACLAILVGASALVPSATAQFRPMAEEERVRLKAALDKEQRERLTGLPSVQVVVTWGDKNEESNKRVASSVEMQLRRNGVPVTADASSLLCVQLVRSVTGKPVQYLVDVKLNELVFLMRNPKKELRADTWENAARPWTSVYDEDAFRKQVQDDIDAFCNDWHAANPKK